MNTICCVFPAFGIEYSENDLKSISLYSGELGSLIEKSSGVVDICENDLEILRGSISFDELKIQYITYIFSCMIADILTEKKITPDYITSYSLGIYASLYFSGSLSFEDGLRVIEKVYSLTVSSLENKKFGMAGIIGLKYYDLKEILKKKEDVEIVNCNNEHSYIISGILDEVENALAEARNEGALSTKLLPINAPYHSKFIYEIKDQLTDYLNGIPINNSRYKYISSIDKSLIDQGGQIRNELIKNIVSEFNWFETMKKIIRLGVNTFIECGLGKSLYKNSKFIDGNYKFFTSSSLDKFI